MSCMCLHSFQSNIEEVDPRSRTPLHLAVSLGHLESVRVLLRHGADVSKENDKNWTGENRAYELHISQLSRSYKTSDSFAVSPWQSLK
uniref:Uncharacterized protein n=1 Tax=Sinocyclocheilus grahami TaxID=75366 RepID=A0A672KD35_SINGR